LMWMALTLRRSSVPGTADSSFSTSVIPWTLIVVLARVHVDVDADAADGDGRDRHPLRPSRSRSPARMTAPRRLE
jgi:hypothetical protein